MLGQAFKAEQAQKAEKKEEVQRVANADPNALDFGFKKSLVRVISNITYKNPLAQNMARDMGALPLLLNQCRIEEKNPCILFTVDL
jgi:hypothetical protein